MANHGAVTWFEIGTDDDAATKAFYGELFGWQFAQDPGAGDMPYLLVTVGDGKPQGGIFPTGGNIPNYAVPYVQVDDVASTLGAAEQRGGKVLVPQQTAPDGLSFAHLIDPQGNHIGVYTPPPGQDV